MRVLGCLDIRMNSGQLVESATQIVEWLGRKQKQDSSRSQSRGAAARGAGRLGTAPRALDPGAQPHLERMGEQVVAGEDADAVVEAAGEAGLHLDAVAMLAVPHVAGV